MSEASLVCCRCSHTRPPADIPSGGVYMCRSCVEKYRQEQEPVLPPGTFKCCPTETSEGKGGVVRCWNCKAWYHCPCLGIADGALRDYISLSTTKWYCPEPQCTEKGMKSRVY